MQKGIAARVTSRTRWRPIASRAAQNGLLWIVVALAATSTVLSNGLFLHPGNLATILYQQSVLATLAVGQTIVLLTAGIDLSVGATTILIAIVIGGLSGPQSFAFPQIGLVGSIGVGLALAALIGFLNGIAVARTRIPPFVVTLAMWLLVSGVATSVTRGYGAYSDPAFQAFGGLKIGILPLPVIGWVALLVVMHLAVSRTAFGAKLYAVGGNEKAARLAGVDVARVKIMAYTLCGLMAGVGSLFFLARTGYAIPSAGSDLLLTSIAAVVIGGVSLFGGEGSLLKVFLGIITIAILGNVMNLMLVPPLAQGAAQGAVIILAVGVDVRLQSARSRGGL